MEQHHSRGEEQDGSAELLNAQQQLFGLVWGLLHFPLGVPRCLLISGSCVHTQQQPASVSRLQMLFCMISFRLCLTNACIDADGTTYCTKTLPHRPQQLAMLPLKANTGRQNT